MIITISTNDDYDDDSDDNEISTMITIMMMNEGNVHHILPVTMIMRAIIINDWQW